MAKRQDHTRIFYPSHAVKDRWLSNGQFVALEQQGRRYFAIREDGSRVETTCYRPSRIDRELAAGHLVESIKIEGAA